MNIGNGVYKHIMFPVFQILLDSRSLIGVEDKFHGSDWILYFSHNYQFFCLKNTEISEVCQQKASGCSFSLDKADSFVKSPDFRTKTAKRGIRKY